jgi:hypothetical protein
MAAFDTIPRQSGLRADQTIGSRLLYSAPPYVRFWIGGAFQVADSDEAGHLFQPEAGQRSDSRLDTASHVPEPDREVKIHLSSSRGGAANEGVLRSRGEAAIGQHAQRRHRCVECPSRRAISTPAARNQPT